MMRRVTVLDLAFLMLVGALPLISHGSVTDTSVVWWSGLIMLSAGFIIPLVLRFIPGETDPKDEPDVGEEPS
jgi:hypothetical protein